MFDPLMAKGKAIIYLTVAFVFGMGMASGLGWTGTSHAMPTVSTQPQLAEEEIAPARDLSDAFVRIAETVTPAVVRIQVRKRARATNTGRVPEPFRQFFQDREMPHRQPPVGGTGFLVSEDGYIMTNDHVVSDAQEITVFLQDRRQFSAELVGNDPTTDVALIKIDADDLPTLSFGDSDALRVGEWVVAVGNPGFGTGTNLDYTVTAGIVSAKGRPLQLLQQEMRRDPGIDLQTAQFAIEDFIQTDAVINPGNSGGPMVNLRGQVVGINSAIATQTGFYQGYGFAIPVNLARRVMEDLVEYGRVRRPWLGIQIRDVDPVDAEAYDLPEVSGILISELPSNSPAADADLRSEDVIVALDGRKVSRVNELQQRVAQHRPGDRVRVTYYRNGERQEATVRLGEAPINTQPEEEPARVARATERLGMQVMDMTPEIASHWGFDRAEGPVVTNVQPYGPAASRGVFPGSRILRIDGQPVANADEVREILEDLEPGEIVNFHLENGPGQRSIVNVRVPE